MPRHYTRTILPLFALALVVAGGTGSFAQLNPQLEQQRAEQDRRSLAQAQQQLAAQEQAEHQRQLEQQREVQEQGDRDLRVAARAERQRETQQLLDQQLEQGRTRLQAEQQQIPQEQQPAGMAQAEAPVSLARPALNQPALDQSGRTFSRALLARSVGVGLLAGAFAVLLGMLIQRQFTHG